MAVRPDLTNKDVERMGRVEPGSAAAYLEERRREIEEETRAAREANDKERWIEAFVAAGGAEREANARYREHMNQRAAEQAAAAESAAVQAGRRRIAGAL